MFRQACRNLDFRPPIVLGMIVKLLPVLLRTFARNFSNIDFSLKILSLKDDELVMSEM